MTGSNPAQGAALFQRQRTVLHVVGVGCNANQPRFTSYQPSLAGFVASRRHFGDADFPPARTTGRRDMTEKLLKAA